MSGYQVDLNGPNEMDSQYWAYLSKQVIDTSVEFIRLLDECKIKMGVKLVPLSLMQKMYKLQTTARYQRINNFIPGVLDHHIEEIIQCTFKKIGKPMPKISAKYYRNFFNMQNKGVEKQFLKCANKKSI